MGIASTPWDVTASLGVACGALGTTGPKPPALLERLVEAADAAMYEAKRAGGNQIRYADHLRS